MRNGTRKSVMALTQTEEIARRLTAVAPDVDVEIVKFETTGDSDQTSKLLQHGGKGGAFVAEIRRRLFRGDQHQTYPIRHPVQAVGRLRLSVWGTFRTWRAVLPESVMQAKADICQARRGRV